MDTTLPLPFLPSVDLEKGSAESTEGLTRSQLSYLGCVHFAASNETLDVLLQFLQRHVSIEAYVDVSRIESTEDIVSVLDAGARKIFVNSKQEEALKIYRERVIPIISSDASQIYPNGVLITGLDGQDPKASLERLAASKTSPIFVSKTASNDIESLVKLATRFSTIPIIPATNLTIEQTSKDLISISALIAATWSSDRTDKLVPTVVTDERGIALGLVYSSQESLAESLKTGTGVYQSRKRGLWYKGATSGDTQELVRISLDCDQDCLKFVVRQKGRGKWPSTECFLLLLTMAWQVSATCPNQLVLASYVELPSLRRHWFRGRLLRWKDHTQRVYFLTRNYFEQR